MLLRKCRYFSTTATKVLGGPSVAVIGSGPSGLYVCARLLQRIPGCRVDVFDRNPAPYGLVYYGVAPDHYDMKKCTNSFERMFAEHRDRLSLYCNVAVSRDVSYEEICQSYEAVVLAYGASRARKMGLENENAINCFSGGEFVFWYNGLPQCSVTPLLDQTNAVVIGNGNVAIDCSRILLSSPEVLAQTDIPESAMKILRTSKVRNVRILGRRGPKESSFTIKELRELLNLKGCTTSCQIPSEVCEVLRCELETMERPRRRLVELLLNSAASQSKKLGERNLSIEFFRRTEKIHVDAEGRVNSLDVRNSATGELETVPCGLLIYAIGFENVLLEGLPRTEDNRLKMADWCHIEDEHAAVYATGWCSHVPRGLIADSQNQAILVADQLVDDWEKGRVKRKGADGVKELLDQRNTPYISWDDWKYIDEYEKRMGAKLGKVREKIGDLQSFIRISRNKDQV